MTINEKRINEGLKEEAKETLEEISEEAKEMTPDEILTEYISNLELLQAKEEKETQLTQNFQRLQADFENFRKRTIKEKEELRSIAAKNIIEDMLPVLDNLHRALDAGGQKGDLEQFIEGVQMIYAQFWGVLEKHGLEYIDCVGSEFDPEIHQAVMQQEISDGEDNKILDEIQKGYLLNGKLIRPSMVCVSKRD